MISGVGTQGGTFGAGASSASPAAQLGELNKQLAAREEQLKAVEKACASDPSKESDQKALSAKIAELRVKIAQLSPAESQPTERTRTTSQATDARARPSSFEVVQLAPAQQGGLGTRVNVLA